MKLARRFGRPLFPFLLAGSTFGVRIGMTDTTAAELRLVAPVNYQVVQRTGRAIGQILIHGSFSAAIPGGGQIETRLTGPGLDGIWRPLASVGGDQVDFRAEFTAPTGGWYQLDVRARHGEETVATAQVEHVGIGEVFVIAGQSNSANHGEERQQPKSGLVAAFSGRNWQMADDPQPGASGTGGSFLPPFADAIATRFKIPVGLVAAGVGATSIREWLPRGTRFPNPPTLTGHVTKREDGEWESNGDLFATFTRRLQALGPQGFRAVLWHQGESDANQTDSSRTLPGALYQKYVEQLIRDSRREAGWDAPWFVAQATYHTPNDPGSPDLRAAQAALWKSGVALEGPDTDALTGEHRDEGGQGVHFSGRGLREHGTRWADKVSPWLESQLATSGTNANTNNRSNTPSSARAQAKVNGPTPRLILPGTENFRTYGCRGVTTR